MSANSVWWSWVVVGAAAATTAAAAPPRAPQEGHHALPTNTVVRLHGCLGSKHGRGTDRRKRVRVGEQRGKKRKSPPEH